MILREIIINTKNCSITENKFKLHLELDNRVYYFYEDSNNHYHNINYQTQFLKKVFPNTGLLTVIEYLDLERSHFGIISYLYLLQFTYEHDERILNKIQKTKIMGT